MARTPGQTAEAAVRQPSPVRAKILAAADELFYAEGIRAVSADRIMAAAPVSKITFYRHFPTKEDLILAYLAGRSTVERDVVERFRAESGDACGTLVAIANGIADISCLSDFRGCPFINAAAEYADTGHPVRHAVAEHRAWFAAFLAEMLSELGIDDAPEVVDQLVMLRDGAMIGGYLDQVPESRAKSIIDAGRAIIDTARR
jgi:AcrR family transcriptional regulator